MIQRHTITIINILDREQRKDAEITEIKATQIVRTFEHSFNIQLDILKDGENQRHRMQQKKKTEKKPSEGRMIDRKNESKQNINQCKRD